MLVRRYGWGHLWLRFIWLGRRKTRAGFILDVVSITIATVCGAYGYRKLERCNKTGIGVPTYWIVDWGTCSGLVGQTPELLRDSAEQTQFRL